MKMRVSRVLWLTGAHQIGDKEPLTTERVERTPWDERFDA